MSLGLNEKPSYDDPQGPQTVRVAFGSVFWPVVSAIGFCSFIGAGLWIVLFEMLK